MTSIFRRGECRSFLFPFHSGKKGNNSASLFILNGLALKSNRWMLATFIYCSEVSCLRIPDRGWRYWEIGVASSRRLLDCKLLCIERSLREASAFLYCTWGARHSRCQCNLYLLKFMIWLFNTLLPADKIYRPLLFFPIFIDCIFWSTSNIRFNFKYLLEFLKQ